MSSVVVAFAEDVLSRAVLARLLMRLESKPLVLQPMGGRDSFLRKAKHLHRTATKLGAVIGLCDLDADPCPRALLDRIAAQRDPRLVIRVAVREIESWLLADHEGMARFLGIASSVIPRCPDQEPDPKSSLLRIAARSRRRDIIRGLCPRPQGFAKVGPEYNRLLEAFVLSSWDVDKASDRSPSLARAVRALAAIEKP